MSDVRSYNPAAILTAEVGQQCLVVLSLLVAGVLVRGQCPEGPNK
jgi:hypothetical protein